MRKTVKELNPKKRVSKRDTVGSKDINEVLKAAYKKVGLRKPNQQHLQLWFDKGNDLAWRFWCEQAKWSRRVFGSDKSRGPIGPILHLKKEIETEILPFLENPIVMIPRAEELEEYVDCFFLIIDATRRAGFSYSQFMKEAFEKLEINKKRKWNKPTSNQPVEHIRK